MDNSNIMITEIKKSDYRDYKRGFTLLETIIACGIMVMAFTILAVIFGRAYTISKTIKRGSKNQRWGAYIMNTILYGPGKTATEGLIAAYRVYHPHLDATPTDDEYPSAFSASYSGTDDPPTNHRSAFLCFSTPDKKPIIYELISTANTLYRNKEAGPNYDHSTHCFDLKPTYAKDGKLEIYYNSSDLPNSSGFYFYKENNTPAANTSEIKRVGIKLVIKNAFQELNQAIVLYQNVRIRNLYSSELE